MAADVRCVVFDFDGVLVDSNAIKIQTYFEIFGDIRDAAPIVQGVLAEGFEGDRYSAIGTIVQRLVASNLITAVAPPESIAAEYAQRYTQSCERAIVVAPEIRGASECLAALHHQLPLYINSATPEPALRRIVEGRRWSGFFRGVLGRPCTKVDNLAAILRMEQVSPQELLFIGDGPDDFRAAQLSGCRFIAVRGDFHSMDYASMPVIDDLSSVCAIVGAETQRASRP